MLKILVGVGLGSLLFTNPEARQTTADILRFAELVICSASGRRRLKVNPRCRDLIRDLKFMVYKEGTDQPDKSDPERSHHSDALGYCALGAMKPLLPDKYKARRSKTITVW